MGEPSVSIAVMPFRHLSSAPDTAYFTGGFVEDLIANLTRFDSLRVVASQSTFGLAQMDSSLQEIAAEWNLQYILDGSVRTRGDTLRVGTQLIRVEDWQTTWAESFDASLKDVFAIQDEITATVAGKLAVQIDDAQLSRARRTAVDDLRAYDCWLRGFDCLRRGTLEGDEESRAFFRQALQIDPSYARAYSGLSVSHFNEWSCQAWHLWDESAENAFDYAVKAAELDDGDAMVQAVAARVCRFRHQHAQADRHAANALALNPNDPHVLIQVAIATLFNGDPEDACVLARKAVRLNPLNGDWYFGIVGWCLFMSGRHADALPHLSRGGETIVNFAAYRSACFALAGDLDEAGREYDLFLREYQEKISFGREPQPGEALCWAIQVEPFRRIEDSRRMPDALRKGGIADVDVEEALQRRPGPMVRPAGIARPPGNVFRKEGRIWSVGHEGVGAKLVDLKGFHDIARLLSEPNVPVHCLELLGAPPAADPRQEVLDPRARREYRQRIEELQADLDQAEANNDLGRAGAIRRELEAVIDELTRSTGLGGRSRGLGDRAERARSAVTWRTRSAIKKIHAAHPRLGQHLQNSIRTGTFCVYRPEIPTNWQV